MACDLSLGRKVPCKDSVGGIKAVYFVNYGTTLTYNSTDTDALDDIQTDESTPGAITAYKYEVKGNSSFEQAITASRENGTAFFEQTLNLTLTKLTKEDHKELKLLTYGRPHVVIHDYNGNAFLMGAEHGADVSGGSITTGAGMGDMSGYTLTLNAMEQVPANFLLDATEADPFAGLTTTPTVTEGTNS